MASIDPATGEVWRTFTAASAADVATAVAAAREAQPGWMALGVRARAARLTAFRRALYRRRAEVAGVLTRENGKPPVEALAAEVMVVLDYARFYASAAPKVMREHASTPGNPALWRKRIRLTHEPWGVVAVISPWNYPFMLAAGIALPALVAGNAVLLKPSEFTPSSGEILASLLHEAGVPAAVFQVLQGAGATGAALVESAVDKVFFTGSVATGRRVAVACASRLIPCSLELGGSDPAIVLEDAAVETAAAGIAWGRYTNAGQTCVAPKRAIVVDAVYDRFLDALTREVRGLRVGPGGSHADVTPLIRPSQVKVLESQLAEAVAGGATVAARAEAPSSGSDAGRYFPPTVLTGVTPPMRVATEETFGPLLAVMRARDADDAVRLANASPFGLSASIWSRDAARARRLARRLDAGTVAINDSTLVAGMAEVPHGGTKASGTGRAHGVDGLRECLRTRTLVVERFAGPRQPWWFGYGARHAADVDAFMGLVHGDSIPARLKGLSAGVRLLMRKPRDGQRITNDE